MRCPRPLVLASVVAVASLALLAAGCGGGGSVGVASGASSTTTQTGATTTQNGRATAALALARCMRSHGIPNWPDPDSTGGFDKSKLRQLGVGVSRMRALEDGACNIPIPSSGSTQTITPAER